MKKADWTARFGVKLAAFLLALAAGFAMLFSGAAILCATENEWWADPGQHLYESDLVRGAVHRAMVYSALPYLERTWDTDALYAMQSGSNYRCTVCDAEGNVLFSSISDGDYRYADTVQTGQLTVRSGVAKELRAQDGIFWAVRTAQTLRDACSFAPALLIGAALALLLLLIALGRGAGRAPGEETSHAGWQEKIPLDLYLAGAGGALAWLAAAAQEIDHSVWTTLNALPLYLTLLALLAGAAMTLLLGTFLTLCARAKLGQWWRNTVVFRVLSWTWRAACALGRVLRAAVFAFPLVWRTAALCVLTAVLILTFAVRRAFGWLLLLLATVSLLLLSVSRQLRRLQRGGAALAGGEAGTRIDTRRMLPDLRAHGENLNDISRGMAIAVEKQLRSERLKTELITNVSHDIKTPLTSIVNYVGLLQREPTPEQAKEYLEVLDRQSRRLKKLTEDLVELSKASTGNVAVNAARRSMSELLLQAVGEYSERLEKAQLEAVLTLPEREPFAVVDGTLTWRVLDNLFSNACKYAQSGTRFYIDAREADGQVKLTFRNVSRERLTASADELLERFVRGDSARGGEGSGLGLNIAKTLTELQGGTFTLTVDGDLFKAEAAFPAG